MEGRNLWRDLGKPVVRQMTPLLSTKWWMKNGVGLVKKIKNFHHGVQPEGHAHHLKGLVKLVLARCNGSVVHVGPMVHVGPIVQLAQCDMLAQWCMLTQWCMLAQWYMLAQWCMLAQLGMLAQSGMLFHWSILCGEVCIKDLALHYVLWQNTFTVFLSTQEYTGLEHWTVHKFYT